MWIGVVSLFPEMFRAISENGVTGRAIKNKLLSIQCWNPRDFTLDKHRTVDDRPYGGGPGMLMMVQPLRDAILAAKQAAREAGHEAKVIYLSPQGRRLDHCGAQLLSGSDALILVAGRYEGVDERIIESLVDQEWSVGDYVLSGGELPAMILIDAVVRFVPGVLMCMCLAAVAYLVAVKRGYPSEMFPGFIVLFQHFIFAVSTLTEPLS